VPVFQTCESLWIGIDQILYNRKKLWFICTSQGTEEKFQQFAKHEEKWQFHHLCQDMTSSNIVSLERFTNAEDILIHCGGLLGKNWEDVMAQFKAMSNSCQDVTVEEIELAKQKAREIYLCSAYLMSSDNVGMEIWLKTTSMHIWKAMLSI